MTSVQRQLRYIRLRNRALSGLVANMTVLFALGQVEPVVGPINTALFTVVGGGARVGALLSLVGFLLAQVGAAIPPPARSSRSSIAPAATDEREEAGDTERHPNTTTEDDPVERIHQRYITGEIGDRELDMELEDALLEVGHREKGRE